MNLINGYPGTTLTVEDEPNVRQPTMMALYEAIERMKPTGPSFVIVKRDGGNYAQVGGGNGEYAVEWWEYGEPFVHLLAGKGAPVEETHRVQMNRGYTQVALNEVLDIEDAKTLLGAFLRDGRHPPGYTWRDVSYAFRKHPHGGEISELGK